MKKSILATLIFVSVVAFSPSVEATQDPFSLEKPIVKVKQQKPKKVVALVIKVEPPKPVTHTIIEGDTLTKIADSYQTTWQRLWQKNLNLTSPDVLNVGEVVTIPTVSEVLAERGLPAAPTVASRPAIPGNAYDPGNCTFFVKTQRPDIGNYWGNADQWAYSAAAAGYLVDNTPSVGSIGVATGYTHVVFVTGVNGDGTVSLSEENYQGLGVVSTRVAPVSEFVYIH